jgi:hypothetical protein
MMARADARAVRPGKRGGIMTVDLHAGVQPDVTRAGGPGGEGRPPNAIDYTVDGEPQQTTERTLTPRQILSSAGIDPQTHYLVEVRSEHDHVSYEGRPDEPIHVHPNQRFVSVSTGPTPVSCGNE